MSKINDAILKTAEDYDTKHPDDQGKVFEQLENNEHSKVSLKNFSFSDDGYYVSKPCCISEENKK